MLSCMEAGYCSESRFEVERTFGQSVCANALEIVVLYTIALVLLVLWVLGMVTSVTAGGLLHVLLVVAVVVVIFQLVSGRQVL